ncbi:MAG TPA: epoxyqueuosine reductase [Firmicutes bacterium]|nr:epoxyqueuosine reductase [Bacillota bacterium]
MLTAADIKKHAKRLGADLVGIAPIERWEGAPKQMDPRYIMPRAKSMIVMGFRVMRGSLRGIEEGTFFSNYSSMGYGGITYLYIPMVVINLCRLIEDEGYEAIPIGHQSDWRAIDNDGRLKKNYSRPVEPGKPCPDIMIHLRIAAFLAGLGEIGYSKMFLTPEFGPRQRFGVVLTELPLDPDPIYDGPPLCNRCMACVRACPGNAIPSNKTVRQMVAGRMLEWADIDTRACDLAFRGGMRTEPGERGDYLENTTNVKPSPISPFYKKPRNLYNTGQAICGAAGCTRACMISLEKRGVLKNRFVSPFREKEPWRVDWSQPFEPDADDLEKPTSGLPPMKEAD